MMDIRSEQIIQWMRIARVQQRILAHASLAEAIRGLLMRTMVERGLVTSSWLEGLVHEALKALGLPDAPEHRREVTAVLTDILAARAFSEKEIQDHIHLAQKLEKFKILDRVVHAEGATSKQIKRALKEFCAVPQGDLRIPPSEAEGVRVALINHFISNQLPFVGIAKKYITLRDIDEMMDRAYWNPRRSGKVGGKAAGMLLAYKILMPRFLSPDPELAKYLRIPESYYFNSGIFSDFIDYNNLHWFRTQKYKTREAIEEEYKDISECFARATYPPDMVAMFKKFLEKVGECPLILRSSSLLEDNFGHAFSGKYDSVFLANQGPLERRLEEFIWGLKRVHMSTYAPAPILYRRDHQLLDFDEKMSVLVQKVVGARYGPYFFPLASGVAFSRNTYRWSPRIREEEGMVRVVFGLGTRAVERIGQDYARLVALSHPDMRPEVSARDVVKYSQRFVDALHMDTGRVETVPFREVLSHVPPKASFWVLSQMEEDHLASPGFSGHSVPQEMAVITFDNLLRRSPFARLLRKILQRLEKAYGHPVDVEFAWHDDQLYLLQCRTLAVHEELAQVDIPKNIPEDRILFTNSHVLFNAVVFDVEYVVYVDPKVYARLEDTALKATVGRVVGKINRALEGKRFALFGPGRWGSKELHLGVPVGYEDINHALVLGEIAFEWEGVTPEVSYGTHFFSDLVEARIVPVAVFPDDPKELFREVFFSAPSFNALAHICPDEVQWAHVIKIVQVPKATEGLWLHVYQDAHHQRGIGFLAPKGSAGR
ncbi:PEP/pyruvate-binding domain-containing protein [Desulfosoma caldarium]|uniref:Phosphoenolpyruvate synthase n=1 Tax=Desulfosoma caldarium TaxID=610254 RepID=A0A3N1VIE1_9BACT|nr:PEP/pyruvate-binding domain-containing protein [Desulfosoma caldarium]ROR01670.1 pyruvate phosphate dikinase-like enzyme [Desulfosoma caldarium]